MPGGKIYYYNYNDRLPYFMNPDGSGQTALPAGAHGEPSQALHSGKRWFLTPGDSNSPSPLVAVPQDGEVVRLQLNGTEFLPTTELHAYGVRWGQNDGKVSFLGQSEGGTGLYVVPIDWSTGSPQTSGSPTLRIDQGKNIRAHDWSPDGNQVVYELYDSATESHSIWVDGVDGRVCLGNGSNPRWSPDGSRIAFLKVVDTIASIGIMNLMAPGGK